MEGREEYRLSELYQQKEETPQLELIVKIININAGQKNAVMQNCRTLREYAEFVRTVREYMEQDPDLNTALQKAVDDCISKGILADFLRENRSMVYKSCLYEFDAKRHDEAMREEGRMEREEEIRSLKKQNKDLMSEIKNLASEVKSQASEIRSQASENKDLASQIKDLQDRLAKYEQV